MTAIKIAEINQANCSDNKAQNVIQQIAKIETALFAHEPWSDEQIISLLNSEFNHIIYSFDEVNYLVTGYCIFQQLFEDAEILKIGTHQPYQRQGIASQLLNFMQDNMRKAQAKRIMLEVREDNISAIKFYQKHGFEQISLRKNYYDNYDTTRTHALILQNTL